MTKNKNVSKPIKEEKKPVSFRNANSHSVEISDKSFTELLGLDSDFIKVDPNKLINTTQDKANFVESFLSNYGFWVRV